MALGNVIFVQGSNIQTADFTPSADTPAGTGVVVGDFVGITTQDLANGEFGSLNISGGVYNCVGDGAIAVGKVVYWDATNKKVTETSTSNKKFGVTVTACSGNNATCNVAHLGINAL